METVFIKLLNMSISASWLILAVVIIRLFLKKVPRWSVCILWGLVALKLIVPFSFKSIFSLIPSDEVIPETIATEVHPHITSGIIYVDTAVNPVMEAHLAPQDGDSANPMQIVIFIASLVWCIGMVICLIYAMTSFIILKRKVRASKKISENIYACDEVGSPFILGIFRPVIYIPSGMGRDTLDYVIDHENAHLKRGDHFWKPLGYIILSVYWFNPLCWIAYILLCRDIEFACDEKVIRDKDNAYVNSYSQALLDCNAHRRIIAACPLAFGETNVKDRIKGVLKYKKPAFWVIIVAIIVCIVVAVCFLTDPKKDESNMPAEQSEIQNDQTEVKPADDSGDNEIVRPQVNLSAPEGADITELLYADKDKIIFSGYYGLFVYSKEQRTITNAIDLASIGCNYTQGDNYCEKFVSSDGNTVYLHPMSNTDMCVYDIGNDSLSRERYNLEGYDLHVAAIEGSYNKGDCDAWTYDGLTFYTVLRHGETIGDLAYADVRLEDSKNAEWIHLFTSDARSGEGPDNTETATMEYEPISYTYQNHPVIWTYKNSEFETLKYATIELNDEYSGKYPELQKRIDEYNKTLKQKISDSNIHFSDNSDMDQHINNFKLEADLYSVYRSCDIIPIRADSCAFSYVLYDQQHVSGSAITSIYWWNYNIDPVSGKDLSLSDIVTDLAPIPDLIIEKLNIINESLPSVELYVGKVNSYLANYMINSSRDFIADERVLKLRTGESNYNSLKKLFAEEQKLIQWALDYDGVWFFLYGHTNSAYGVKILYKDHPELFSERFFPDTVTDITSLATQIPDAETEYENIYSVSE